MDYRSDIRKKNFSIKHSLASVGVNAKILHGILYFDIEQIVNKFIFVDSEILPWYMFPCDVIEDIELTGAFDVIANHYNFEPETYVVPDRKTCKLWLRFEPSILYMQRTYKPLADCMVTFYKYYFDYEIETVLAECHKLMEAHCTYPSLTTTH